MTRTGETDYTMKHKARITRGWGNLTRQHKHMAQTGHALAHKT